MIAGLFWYTEKKNFSEKNGPAFYPGPVLPPRADGSPLAGLV